MNLQTSALPDTDPRSVRPSCGGRASNVLGETQAAAPARSPASSRFRTWLGIVAGLLSFALAAHGTVTEFPSSGGITINDNTTATPYPSTIAVSGITGTVTAVRVKINGFTHTYPDDVDVFLVAPGSQVSAVLSDSGGSTGITNVNLVFDDAAGSAVPDSSAITSGTYVPANYEPGESLPPGGVGSIGTNLTALAAGGVNGDWKLYVRDDLGGDFGSIGSWTVVIEYNYSPPAPEIAVEQPPGANVGDGGSKQFGSVNVSSNNILTFTIKNAGTADLTSLEITVDGPDAAMFAVTTNPVAPVASGGSTTFTVRFAPASLGAKTAALHIASNDGDENPFDISFTGNGIPAATEAWVKLYSGPGSGEDYAEAVVVDGSGNVVVTGHSSNGTNADFYTAKYAATDGALLWEKRYNGPENYGDYGTAMAVDGSGNVVVTGYSNGTSHDDYYTAKYAAADGALLWEKRYNGPGNGYDAANAVAVDGSGNVVVTGYSNNETSDDYYTAKYAAADGALLWEKRYNGPGNSADSGNAVAVDGSGNVVVTGNSPGLIGSFHDYYTAKYAAADGALLWEKRYNGPGTNDDFASAVVVDNSGNVVVTGYSTGSGINGPDYYTAQYAAADGALLWEKRYNGPPGNNLDRAKAVALDGNGNVVVTGESYNGIDLDYYTAKYAAADGALLWEKRYSVPASNFPTDTATAVAVDGSGNVVVTGYSYAGNASRYDYYTAKYAAADGALLWEKRYNGPASSDDVTGARRCLALGPNGMVAVTGHTFVSGFDYDYATVVYREIQALAPEIVIEQPLGIPLVSGTSTITFSSQITGTSSAAKTFTIKNTGTGPLSITGVSTTGGNSGDFIVNTTGMLTSIPAASQTTFAVAFLPTATGSRATTLRVINDDSDENPFDVALAGQSVTALQAFAAAAAAAGLTGADAAADAIPFSDGVANLLKYAFKMNLAGPDSHSVETSGSSGLPAATYTRVGTQPYMEVRYVRRKDIAATYTLQRTRTLVTAFNETDPPDDGTIVDPIDTHSELVRVRIPVDPITTPQGFTRVRVQVPSN